ncbi:MAG: hypothetical protein LBE71_00430 [Dysgonamonadaceae bacterium]|nr:hypothetical protein [Dysgonamonadaceae bacterium]
MFFPGLLRFARNDEYGFATSSRHPEPRSGAAIRKNNPVIAISGLLRLRVTCTAQKQGGQ